MKRWNGWGNANTDYPVPPPALDHLTKRLCKMNLIPDASKETVLSAVTVSRLPAHPLVDTSAEERLMHSRGKSMQDWVDLNYGRVNSFNDCVAFSETGEDVRGLLKYAKDAGANVIHYGGGTSVVGHIAPCPDGGPVLSPEKMTKLIDFDKTSRLANFQASVAGRQLEEKPKARSAWMPCVRSFSHSTLME